MKLYQGKRWKKLVAAINATLLAGAFSIVPVVEAYPTGGVSTTASISGTTKMTITGTEQNNLINWQTFSIGVGESVTFSDNRNYLNYVVGNERSDIMGTLIGKGGDIYIINPHGILFGKGATVDVGAGSLIASTRSLTEDQLTAFTTDGTNPLNNTIPDIGDIVNQGATLKAKAITLEGDTITFTTLNTEQTAIDNVTLPGDTKINAIARTEIDVGYNGLSEPAAAPANLNFNKAVTWCQLIDRLDTITSDFAKPTPETNGKYMLSGDITAADDLVIGIGSSQADSSGIKSFTGLLNGAGYKITQNIKNRSDWDNVGLFAKLNGASVRNLTLAGKVEGNFCVGALAGEMDRSKISSVYNEATVKGNNNRVGGVIGNGLGTIVNVSNSGVVTSDTGYCVGGIAGRLGGSTITNAYNGNTVTGYGEVGGVVGQMSNHNH